MNITRYKNLFDNFFLKWELEENFRPGIDLLSLCLCSRITRDGKTRETQFIANAVLVPQGLNLLEDAQYASIKRIADCLQDLAEIVRQEGTALFKARGMQEEKS